MARKAPGARSPDEIGIDEIMARLPHRHPFLLIDRAVEFKANQSIVGIKCVTVNEPFFQGHFPAYPVMPGVLIIEAMAQTGAVLMSKSLDIDIANKSIFFISLDNCRFRAPARPGDMLRLAVQVIKHRGDLYKFRGEAFIEETLAAECEFAAMVMENP
jgi:3-hydroxyacyl-[acyl-carrier-protein] dehydratase